MAKLINDDCLNALMGMESNSVDSIVTDPPAGIAFMGKDWDKHKGGRDSWIAWLAEIMTECNRVLKPGGHALVWSIPRTQHWTATAVENAGFEIRDVVCHLFGSGFPKSQNISKAIDKAAGHLELTSEPITPEAKKWDGFGTALKPAYEGWILARKPISEKTIAKNVIRYGTGGINIDGCRIGSEKVQCQHTSKEGGYNKNYSNSEYKNKREYSTQGRFPANLILDESVVGELDAQSGVLISKWGSQKTKHKGEGSMFGLEVPEDVNKFSGDSGGASRFFYCSKASKKDKGTDNIHPTCKNTKLMSYLIKLITPPNGTVIDPFMGSGSTGVSAIKEGFEFVGIEKEKEYFEIAKNRINGAT